MRRASNLKRHRWLLIGTVLQLVSYGLPFWQQHSGLVFFYKVLQAMFGIEAVVNNWMGVCTLFAPLLVLPLLLYWYFHKKAYTQRLKWLTYLGLWLPHTSNALEVYRFYAGRWNHTELTGYYVWTVSFFFLGLAFLQKRSEAEQEEDFSEHLIEE